MLLLSLSTWSFFCWMGRGAYPETYLLKALFCQSTPPWLKVMGGLVGGGPCDFSVSPSPFGLDFGTLDLDFGLGLDNIPPEHTLKIVHFKSCTEDVNKSL